MPKARTSQPRKVASARPSASKQRPSAKQKKRAHTPSPKFYGIPRWLCIVVVVLLVGLFLYDPLKNLYHAKRDEAILLQEKQLTEEANAETQETVDKLSTEEGIKDEARLHGYVEQGENPVTVEGLDQNQTLENASPAPSDIRAEVLEQPDPFYITLGDFVFGYNKQSAP